MNMTFTLNDLLWVINAILLPGQTFHAFFEDLNIVNNIDSTIIEYRCANGINNDGNDENIKISVARKNTDNPDVNIKIYSNEGLKSESSPKMDEGLPILLPLYQQLFVLTRTALTSYISNNLH